MARYVAAIYQGSRAGDSGAAVPRDPSLADVLFPNYPGTVLVFRPDGVPIEIEHLGAFNSFWKTIISLHRSSCEPDGTVKMARERFRKCWELATKRQLPGRDLSGLPPPWQSAGLQSGHSLRGLPELDPYLRELVGIGAWCRQAHIGQDPHTCQWNVRNWPKYEGYEFRVW